MPEIPIREFCCVCGKISRVGFWVPNDVWEEVVHPSKVHDPHCLDCFTARADDKLIPWDKAIKLYPTSMVSHIKVIEEAERMRCIERSEGGYVVVDNTEMVCYGPCSHHEAMEYVADYPDHPLRIEKDACSDISPTSKEEA